MRRASSVTAVLLPLALAVGSFGCGSTDGDGNAVKRERRGDTLFLHVGADATPPLVRVDSVEVLWQSDSLENPVAIARADDRLFVADRHRLHIVTAGGEYRSTTGRAGEGPGEFGCILAVGARGDTVVTLDPCLDRHSLFDLDGTLLTTYRTETPLPYVNPLREGQQLRFAGTGLLFLARENVSIRRPMRIALVWRSLEGDSVRFIREWDDVSWRMLGQLLSHRSFFPGRGLAASGPSSRYAFGDGLEYCVTLAAVDAAKVHRLCRAWDRVPVGPETRDPNLDDLPEDASLRPGFADMLREALAELEMPDRRPSYDRLLFGSDGRLWVRTIGPETPDVHPWVLGRVPSLQPSHRSWDVYAIDDGLIRTVELPGAFEPRIAGPDEVIGFYELATGEIVIGRVRL